MSDRPTFDRKQCDFSMIHHRCPRVMAVVESYGAWSPISKSSLVPSKSYENKIYYISFDASRLALQHGVIGFIILNKSPNRTGFILKFSELFDTPVNTK